MTPEVLARIKEEVHLPLKWERYKETHIRNETNCYSHAIGATSPKLEYYRIGAISEKKEIDERFKSISEIIFLLMEDLTKLDLKYEAISESDGEPKMEDNQHIIRLYVKIYANGIIGDYHFIRFDEGFWTEKWKGRKVSKAEPNDYENRWEWRRVIDLKITR